MRESKRFHIRAMHGAIESARSEQGNRAGKSLIGQAGVAWRSLLLAGVLASRVRGGYSLSLFREERPVDERDALLQAVRDLEPAIRAAADEAESGRRVPLALVRQLAEAGVFRMMVPRVYGGFEVEPLTAFEVVEAISRIDGSIGWIAMIGSGSPAFVAPYLV
ncbi:MAG: acyl-CoA dehydrogenase family protein, partial [Vicinamibacterales bacterium]